MTIEWKRVLTLNREEQEMMVKSLYDMRNAALRMDIDTEEVDDLIVKVMDAPTRKEWKKHDRQAR